MVFLSLSALAVDCGKPKAWWETAFPSSVESRPTKQAIYNIDEEFGQMEESSEPEVYHWDNIYLEPSYPEVIIDPYADSRDITYYYDDEDY